MIKKISGILVLSVALIFSGMFTTQVDAASKSNDFQSHLYKIVYNINDQWGQDGQNNWFKQIQQSLKEYDWNFNNQTQQKPEQPAPEKPEQEEAADPAPNKPSTPKLEQPAEPAPTPPQNSGQDQEQNQGQIDQLNEFEQQVIQLTNDERAKAGLAPLKADWELSRVARDKSLDMQKQNYFDHNSPTYGSPFDMMQAYGINYRTAGENIAYGQRTPQEVVNAWMNSPGHRENIMNGNFTHIGVGYIQSGNYWTQMFIGK